MTKIPAPRLILGSSSPRRLELLKNIRIAPDLVVGADIDETPRKGETPATYVKRMAAEKNAALAGIYPHDFILTADTSVVVGRRIIGKAADAAEQKKFMHLLSGRAHQVMTAVTLRAPDGKIAHRLQTSRIKMKRLTDTEIDAYVAENEWQGKAGYAFDSWLGHAAVIDMRGSVSGIIGLPLYETAQLFKGLGYADRD